MRSIILSSRPPHLLSSPQPLHADYEGPYQELWVLHHAVCLESPPATVPCQPRQLVEGSVLSLAMRSHRRASLVLRPPRIRTCCIHFPIEPNCATTEGRKHTLRIRGQGHGGLPGLSTTNLNSSTPASDGTVTVLNHLTDVKLCCFRSFSCYSSGRDSGTTFEASTLRDLCGAWVSRQVLVETCLDLRRVYSLAGMGLTFIPLVTDRGLQS